MKPGYGKNSNRENQIQCLLFTEYQTNLLFLFDEFFSESS